MKHVQRSWYDSNRETHKSIIFREDHNIKKEMTNIAITLWYTSILATTSVEYHGIFKEEKKNMSLAVQEDWLVNAAKSYTGNGGIKYNPRMCEKVIEFTVWKH